MASFATIFKVDRQDVGTGDLLNVALSATRLIFVRYVPAEFRLCRCRLADSPGSAMHPVANCFPASLMIHTAESTCFRPCAVPVVSTGKVLCLGVAFFSHPLDVVERVVNCFPAINSTSSLPFWISFRRPETVIPQKGKAISTACSSRSGGIRMDHRNECV